MQVNSILNELSSTEAVETLTKLNNILSDMNFKKEVHPGEETLSGDAVVSFYSNVGIEGNKLQVHVGIHDTFLSLYALVLNGKYHIVSELNISNFINNQINVLLSFINSF